MTGRGHPNDSAAKQIRNVLIVLSSAVLTGALVLAAMIYQWGSEGSYLIQDVLLAPEVLPKLSYSNTQPNTSNVERLVFDRVEFKYFDSASRQWKSIVVPESIYKRFYHLIHADRSVEKTISARFDHTHPSSLTIWVKPLTSGSADRYVFQEVNLSEDGSLYRVELRGQTKGDWIYFKHPDIRREAMALFVSDL